MKLTELYPQFKKMNSDISLSTVANFNEAHCLLMLCPKCFGQNKGEVGTHSILIYFRERKTPDFNEERKSVLTKIYNSRYKWEVSGNSFEDFTVRPSIFLNGGCGAHFFVTNGEIIGV